MASATTTKTNNQNAPAANNKNTDGRDALDKALTRSLRTRRSFAGAAPTAAKEGQPSRSPAPTSPAISPDTLLRYVEGTLDTETHAQVERQLLERPVERATVADLKAALSKPEAHTEATTKTCGRLVFCWMGDGQLQFLRSSGVGVRDDQDGGPQDQRQPEAGPSSYRYSFPLPASDLLIDLSPTPDKTVTLTLRSGASIDVVTADGARPVGAGLTIAGLGCARHELRLRSDGTDSAQRSGAPSTDADLGSLVVDLRSV